MTDYTDLIARLRMYDPQYLNRESADALEAQARRIAELEDKLEDEEYVSKDTNEMFHEVRDDLQVSLHVNDQLRARIVELEKALRLLTPERYEGFDAFRAAIEAGRDALEKKG